jgi:hypothetical protein
MINTIKKIIKFIITTTGVFFFWIIMHYIASHAYIYFCVPESLTGFLLSPFLVPTPHCSLLRWAIQQGGENINLMWILLSAWIVKALTIS